ncbi:MAG: MATE family efflux transporter [Streptosporangiales bacterium]|nr:MATE family efflux transporter [Streptosporangiales bacterium]
MAQLPLLPLRHPHDREILRLAIPAFGALVAEPLFLLADSAIVGHLGTPQLAGLGVAGTVLQTAIYLCVFLAYGTTARVARQLGAGNRRAALEGGVDGVWLAVAIGLGILAVGIPAAPLVVGMFSPSEAVASHAVVYLRISLAGMPPMLMVLAATGVLRGLQDTRTPLVVAAVGSAANVVLNIGLVYGAGLGLAGSALGTVLAQTGMAAAYLVVVIRGARRHGARLRPHGPGILASGAAGIPLFVRTLTLRVVLIVATAVATRLGDAPLAAHQVAFTIWTFLALALDAVAIAAQAIVGRYLGASDVVGARAATRRMMEWGVAAGAALGVLVAVARPAYVPLFTPDPEVRALLAAALLVMAVLQPLAGVVFVLDGVLIGAGDGPYLAAAGVAAMLAFLPAAWVVLATGIGLTGLWWAIGLWVVARLVTLGLRARGSAWLVTGPVRAERR